MHDLVLVLCVMFGPAQEPHCHRVPTDITYDSLAECKNKATADGGPLLMQAGREAMAAGIMPVYSAIACKPSTKTRAQNN
ncbi:MAG: hypothetical protein Unbinned4026contig1001_18 [Prokaryotic dsDNA virus sp.]|nr:MAG: hypothetical protein Unbinned4026contig1001_18 [Prokaryotic dsDNA virus sp.]